MENKGFVHGVDMNEKRINAMKRLVSNRDFKIYQGMEEELLQSMATKLLSSKTDKEGRDDELMEAQGGYFFRTRMGNLLNRDNQE